MFVFCFFTLPSFLLSSSLPLLKSCLKWLLLFFSPSLFLLLAWKLYAVSILLVVSLGIPPYVLVNKDKSYSSDP